MAPCSYVNDATTDELGSLLLIKVGATVYYVLCIRVSIIISYLCPFQAYGISYRISHMVHYQPMLLPVLLFD